MASLILIRHGESEWNALGKWTGLTDISLSEKGREEARNAAEALRNTPIHVAYTSKLARAKQTIEEILHTLSLSLRIEETAALNEKNYGDYTGKNKWEVKEAVGPETFQKIRRSWDYRIPNGESLEDVYNRVVPFYESDILPKLKAGENVLMTSHGNTVRALVKHLENIPDEEIPLLEIGTGEVYVYTVDDKGTVTGKTILSSNANKGNI